MPELQQTLYSISSNLYQQAGGAPGAEAPGGGAPGAGAPGGESGSSSDGGGDDVIDAEFSETETK